jgi:hypothetical protein
MEPTAPGSKLRQVAEYRVARGTLRLAGAWSVLFGALSIAAGWMWTPVDWALTVLGLALVCTGAGNFLAPRPTFIVADAVTLLLVGAYNLVGAILAVMDGLPPSPVRAFLGVLQLVWGVKRLGNFGRFADTFLARPSDAETREIDESVIAIRKAMAQGAPGVIDFTARGMVRKPWRAWLEGENAVFVEAAGRAFLVGTRQNVTIVPRGASARAGVLEAELAVGAARLRITTSAESYRFYERWKAGPGVSKTAAA